ncbi:MAG: hypothetical protein R3E58_01690 [Phycisphaerae bacterium]
MTVIMILTRVVCPHRWDRKQAEDFALANRYSRHAPHDAATVAFANPDEVHRPVGHLGRPDHIPVKKMVSTTFSYGRGVIQFGKPTDITVPHGTTVLPLGQLAAVDFDLFDRLFMETFSSKYSDQFGIPDGWRAVAESG